MSTQTHTRPELQWDLADRLRKSLRISGVTSNAMGEYLDLSRTSISAYINGRTHPDQRTLRLWALRTGVPLEWLEHGADPGDDPDGGGEVPHTDGGSGSPMRGMDPTRPYGHFVLGIAA